MHLESFQKIVFSPPQRELFSNKIINRESKNKSLFSLIKGGQTLNTGEAKLRNLKHTTPAQVKSDPSFMGIPMEVFLNHILPHLSGGDLNSLLRVNKQFSDLKKHQAFLIKLLKNGVQSPLETIRIKGKVLPIGECIDSKLIKELSIQKPEVSDLKKIEQNNLVQSIRLENGPTLKDKDLIELVNKCESLTSLHLINCKKISDKSLKEIAKKNSISELNISWNEKIDCSGLEKVTKGLPHLTYLSIRGCTKVKKGGREAIFKNCSSLQVLDLGWQKGMLDDEMEHIAKCRNLTSLDLSGCIQLTTKGFESVVKNCPNLKTLIVDHCMTLTTREIEALRSLRTELKIVSKCESKVPA